MCVYQCLSIYLFSSTYTQNKDTGGTLPLLNWVGVC